MRLRFWPRECWFGSIEPAADKPGCWRLFIRDCGLTTVVTDDRLRERDLMEMTLEMNLASHFSQSEWRSYIEWMLSPTVLQRGFCWLLRLARRCGVAGAREDVPALRCSDHGAARRRDRFYKITWHRPATKYFSQQRRGR